jgi:hypothetical protein
MGIQTIKHVHLTLVGRVLELKRTAGLIKIRAMNRKLKRDECDGEDCCSGCDLVLSSGRREVVPDFSLSSINPMLCHVTDKSKSPGMRIAPGIEMEKNLGWDAAWTTLAGLISACPPVYSTTPHPARSIVVLGAVLRQHSGQGCEPDRHRLRMFRASSTKST